MAASSASPPAEATTPGNEINIRAVYQLLIDIYIAIYIMKMAELLNDHWTTIIEQSNVKVNTNVNT
jgi:hypothetical protein